MAKAKVKKKKNKNHTHTPQNKTKNPTLENSGKKYIYPTSNFPPPV